MTTRQSIAKGIGRGAIILLAAIGAWSAGSALLDFHKRPSAFSTPSRFLIVEVQTQHDRTVRLFLEGATHLEDVRFEGSRLVYSVSPMQHPQAAVPLKGFKVSGTGRILFGKAFIELSEAGVSINGVPLCPIEFTVGENGSFREGDVRIAH